jgi:hypothetical protein
MTALQRRVKAVRARARTRRWAYRQRELSQGAWFRLRWPITFASEAYELDEAQATAMLASGAIRDPGGRDLEPAKVILWITVADADRLDPRTRLPLRLDARLLSARWIALVPFRPGAIAPARP